MRTADVFVHNQKAGVLSEQTDGSFIFCYDDGYFGLPVSLTLPMKEKKFEFNSFPPFFDGLLPEGIILEGLLRQKKIDKNDLFSQLLAVGEDLVGAVTVREKE